MFWSVFPLFLFACGAAAATGSMFPPGEWYRALNKPVWTPPDWLFPVAWTTLYLASAFAATRVAVLDGSEYGMGFWALQIALNTLWTPVFFGLEKVKAGLVVLIFLWLAVLGCIVTFLALDTLAGVLMMPYLLWVSVAGALNIAVWRLNPDQAA